MLNGSSSNYEADVIDVVPNTAFHVTQHLVRCVKPHTSLSLEEAVSSTIEREYLWHRPGQGLIPRGGGGGDEDRRRNREDEHEHKDRQRKRNEEKPIRKGVRRPFVIRGDIKVKRKARPNVRRRDGKCGGLHRRRSGIRGTNKVCSDVDDGGSSDGGRRRFEIQVVLRLCGNAYGTEHHNAHLLRREFVGVGTRSFNSPNAYKPGDCKCGKEDRGDGEGTRMSGARGREGCTKMEVTPRSSSVTRAANVPHSTLTHITVHLTCAMSCIPRRAHIVCVTRCLGPPRCAAHRGGAGAV